MAWNEDAMHRWLARRPPPAVLTGSAGHDAAVLKRLAGRPVLCVDHTILGVHYDEGVAPARVGAKAVGRALSDLAATAALPVGVLLALHAPESATERRLRALIDGVERRANALGAELLGGDLSCSPGPETLTVTAFGEFTSTRRPPGRDRARAGQALVATGPVGGSRARRHLAIEPRLAAGRWLFEHGATAMMDVSDGLALDLFRMARASSVGFRIEHVPIHRDARAAARASGRTPLDHALHDGEDHELIATLDESQLRKLLARSDSPCPEFVAIGRVEEGAGVRFTEVEDQQLGLWDSEGARPARNRGWIHGA